MPKVHNIGKTRFTQYIDFPVKWGWRCVVRGWTQEIEEPFRTANPLIFRLPFHKAFVVGKWNGQVNEEEALSKAVQSRVLTDEDFSEEKGWVPAAFEADEAGEESCKHNDSRLSDVGGECAICYWQRTYRVDEEQK
jgi:hypothetical protein